VKQALLQMQAAPPVPRLRIVDVVFNAASEERRSWVWIAALVTLAAHASAVLWTLRSERSLESWSADVAARVHAAIGREQYVELAKPPPPPHPPPEQAPKAVPKARGLHPKQPVERSKPPPPAQAGNIIARETKPDAPADLTGDTFVTGKASAYAGGVTSSTGTNPVAVQAREVDPRSPPNQPDRSSAVSLEDQDWNCPWPREAEAEQIDEQTVVLRVTVRPDGVVELATIVNDPGHGFGQQAVACAMRTKFTPARDREGRPIRAQSPPIRVRFTR
jgi:periplasmic protein TonB